MVKPKFFITTTIPLTWIFFKGQPRLWKNDFDVCAISSDGKEFDPFVKDEGIRKHIIPMKREISILHDIWSLILFILFFLKERPMIVHGNTPKAAMLSMVAAWMTRRPIRIYMCHGLRYQGAQGKLRNLLMAMEKLSCKCATNVICVSDSVKEQFIADGICPQKKVKVVGYGTAGGIDTEHYKRGQLDTNRNVRNELGISEDAFVFCFVGRVVADKGINELVEATEQLLEKHNNVYLLLIGPEEKKLNPISSKSRETIYAKAHIHALGWQDDMRPYVAASDAFVLPSYREGVGMVILEANALDVPAIATDIIGCRDVIVPNVNGVLVKPRDTDSLYSAMKEWVEHTEVVKEMSKKCRQIVLERYSHESVRDAYYKEYRRLAGFSN